MDLILLFEITAETVKPPLVFGITYRPTNMEITTPRFKLSDFLRNFFLLFAILLFFPNLPILYGLCEIAYRIPNLHNVQINWGFFICAKNKRFRYPIIQRPIILKLTDELCSM